MQEASADVCLDKGVRYLVAICKESARGRFSDFRQRGQLFDAPRQPSVMMGDDLPGELPQRKGPAVVAKPLPGGQDLGNACPRQRAEAGVLPG